MASATAVGKQKVHRATGDGQEKRTHAKGTPQNDSTQLLLVSQEIMRLVEASQEGRLAERARAEQFEGVQREMMQGVNAMLDAILLPIGEGNRILAQISAGRIDELIAQTYKGDHEFMRCLCLQARRHRATPHPAEIDATGSLAEVAKAPRKIAVFVLFED